MAKLNFSKAQIRRLVEMNDRLSKALEFGTPGRNSANGMFQPKSTLDPRKVRAAWSLAAPRKDSAREAFKSSLLAALRKPQPRP